MSSSNIFKACDIRGVAGSELTPAIALRIGRSLGAMILRRQGAVPVCLGGDYRRTTSAIKQAMLEGLLEYSVCVRDIGQAPTPVVYFAAEHLQCPSAVMITASHNPGKYNGIKFMLAGQPAVPELMRELEEGVASLSPSNAARGQVESFDVIEAYESYVREKAAALAPSESIAGKKIVLDAMEGAFTTIAPRVLSAEGCNVVNIGGDVDPDFATRTPNPAVDENLSTLSTRVVAESADLGIALDGDGDRAAFVDHTGRIARAEQIGALLVEHCFPSNPTVVYDQKCASVLAKAVQAARGKAIMQPSGYGFIKTAMIQNHADLGVEVSGHYFFKALCGGDDGLFAALVVARVLAQSGKSLAEQIQSIGWPTITPDLRIPFQGDAEATLNRIAKHCGSDRILRMDGVRAQYDDGWALARASITEPLLTLRFEGADARSLKRIADRFLSSVPELKTKAMEKLHA